MKHYEKNIKMSQSKSPPKLGRIKLPPLNRKNSLDFLEIRKNTAKNMNVSYEIEMLQKSAVFYGQKLEKEQEAFVR